jgi:hypothetical protein
MLSQQHLPYACIFPILAKDVMNPQTLSKVAFNSRVLLTARMFLESLKQNIRNHENGEDKIGWYTPLYTSCETKEYDRYLENTEKRHPLDLGYQMN